VVGQLARRAGQRLLQRRHSLRLGVAGGLQHRSRRGHVRRHHACRYAGPQLRPPLLVSLNCLLFRRSHLHTSLSLTLTLLSNNHPGVDTGDRRPTNVIGDNLNTTASEENSPPFNRRNQVQLKHRQRNKVGQVHVVVGWLGDGCYGTLVFLRSVKT
jgi:hypothetical protein